MLLLFKLLSERNSYEFYYFAFRNSNLFEEYFNNIIVISFK
jgi:hypothetical protein